MSCFGIPGFMGMIIRNSPDLWVYFEMFLRIYGYTFEKVFRIYGWYFYDLNGTTPYLGNSSYPPPPPRHEGCYETLNKLIGNSEHSKSDTFKKLSVMYWPKFLMIRIRKHFSDNSNKLITYLHDFQCSFCYRSFRMTWWSIFQETL